MWTAVQWIDLKLPAKYTRCTASYVFTRKTMDGFYRLGPEGLCKALIHHFADTDPGDTLYDSLRCTCRLKSGAGEVKELDSPLNLTTRVSPGNRTHCPNVGSMLGSVVNAGSTLNQYWVAARGIRSDISSDRSLRWTSRQDVEPMFGQCWVSVYDAGPAFTQQWLNVSCLLQDGVLKKYDHTGYSSQITEFWRGANFNHCKDHHPYNFLNGLHRFDSQMQNTKHTTTIMMSVNQHPAASAYFLGNLGIQRVVHLFSLRIIFLECVRVYNWIKS